jgi:catechol 2,3-dioxygenase-like lactoylglutathione lyase family enzyme
MKVQTVSIFVDDQDKAEKFYTETLGFTKVMDMPAGEFRWITVASPEDPNGTQLSLEPNDNPIAKAYQKGLYDQGLPYMVFGVADVQAEYDRLKGLGVKFTMEPTDMGPVVVAQLEDTVGNIIQIAHLKSE